MKNATFLFALVVALAIHESRAFPSRDGGGGQRGRGPPGRGPPGRGPPGRGPHGKPRNHHEPCRIVNTTSGIDNTWPCRKNNSVCELQDEGCLAQMLTRFGFQLFTCKPKECLEDADCTGDKVECRESPCNATFKICQPKLTPKEYIRNIFCSHASANNGRTPRFCNRCDREREDEDEDCREDVLCGLIGDDQEEENCSRPENEGRWQGPGPNRRPNSRPNSPPNNSPPNRGPNRSQSQG